MRKTRERTTKDKTGGPGAQSASLCTSSRSSFIFVFGFCGCMQLVLALLSSTGISVYLMTSNTEFCDESDGEVGEGVVEEELADKPGTTNGT